MTSNTTICPRIFLGLGSNIGERSLHLKRAGRMLDESPDTRYIRRSPIYETEPVGLEETDPNAFLNCCIELRTSLSPEALLERCLEIEDAVGRERTGATDEHESRCIDIDILLFGRQIIETDKLIVPHPRLHVREFVLRPLADIAPEVQHPKLDRPIAELSNSTLGAEPAKLS